MRLEGYQLQDEIRTACDNYERDTKISLNSVVERFLEKYLYEHGYLNVGIDFEDMVTSEESKSKKKTHDDGFKMIKQAKNIRLYHGDLDFSSHSPELIEDIKTRILDSDKEMGELSRNNFEGTVHAYKRMLYGELKVPFPKKKNYNKRPLRNIYQYRNGKYEIRKGINGEDICFCIGISKKEAVKIRDFLEKKDWNLKYAPCNTALKGKNQSEFLLNEIRKEES